MHADKHFSRPDTATSAAEPECPFKGAAENVAVFPPVRSCSSVAGEEAIGAAAAVGISPAADGSSAVASEITAAAGSGSSDAAAASAGGGKGSDEGELRVEVSGEEAEEGNSESQGLPSLDGSGERQS